MKRMGELRWKDILKGKDFVGVTLRDELIKARKADLIYIAELEGQVIDEKDFWADLAFKVGEYEDIQIPHLKKRIAEQQATIDQFERFLTSHIHLDAGEIFIRIRRDQYIVELEAQIEAVYRCQRWEDAMVSQDTALTSTYRMVKSTTGRFMKAADIYAALDSGVGDE